LAGCRALLRRALTEAVATVSKDHGSDPASWRQPVLCPDDATPTCDENRPVTAGALATPSQPFENRGTFHQAVEVLGPVAAGSRGAVPATAVRAALPATGAAPFLALGALVLTALAVTLRRCLNLG
ncbi:MAG: hypothetical protein WCD35_17750, partial [Mycobacteriales bacterium]